MDDHGGFNKAWSDIVIAMLAMLMFVAALMLPHVAERVKKAAEASSEPPGTVVVTADWAPDSDADVDLWVQAPGDRPVGYSNKGGAIFNLLRDDLGQVSDASHLNAEVAYARGHRAGTYTVNVHLYRVRYATLPLTVRVVVSLKSEDSETLVQAWSGDVVLPKEGAEVTAVRFRLDASGRLVPGSVDQVQVPLRSAGA